MKNKIFLTLLFLIITNMNQAQSKSYIEVKGVSTYNYTIKKYTAQVVVSEDFAGYSDTIPNINNLKKKYFNALKQKGIDIDKLKEEPYNYAILSLRKPGVFLSFETSSKEIFTKFLSVQINGVQHFNKNALVTPSKNEAELALKAIENAKEKALKIAKKLQKKPGNIITIINHNIFDEMVYLDTTVNDLQYIVTVRFELLDY